VSLSQANVRARLAAVAKQMQLPDTEKRLHSAVGSGQLWHAKPHEVFGSALSTLRDRAVSAQDWSDSELQLFEEHMALLIAGLRAQIQDSGVRLGLR
jgi:hypothetical protein